MAKVQETHLPGVGVRHDFETASGQRIGIVVHHGGRREIVVYDEDDPDAGSELLDLSAQDASTMAELLGASQVTEVVTAVQQNIEGLAIEWIQLLGRSPAVDTAIRQGEYRSRTGASVVAVLRDHQSVPAPNPDFVFRSGDVVVAVGTVEGLAHLRSLLTQ